MTRQEDEARSEAARLMGRKGGQARAKKLTAAQRKRSARAAAKARWRKSK